MVLKATYLKFRHTELFSKLTFSKIKDCNPAQCGNFRIFLTLRFLREINLKNLEVAKLPFFTTLGALNYVKLVKFSHLKVKKKNSNGSKMCKMADLALLKSSILISRKIWGIEKSWNFHTVPCFPKYTTFSLRNVHYIEWNAFTKS